MKSILVSVILLATAIQCAASVVMVNAYQKGDDVVLMIQGRKVTQEQLGQELVRFSKINPTMTIYLRTVDDISLSNALNILKCIKSSGLLRVVLMSDGKFKNESGTFVFPISMQTNGVGFCNQYVEQRDFLSDSSISNELSGMVEIEQPPVKREGSSKKASVKD